MRLAGSQHHGAPTGSNAAWPDVVPDVPPHVLPDIVQARAVHVPPDRGGHRHALWSVALHLGQVLAAGAQRALPFAVAEPTLHPCRRLAFRLAGALGPALSDAARTVA